jgi:hypothetical protein
MRSTIKTSVATALALTGLWASAAIALAEPTEPAPAPPAAPKTSIDADGTYKVGVDLVPGVYKSAGPIEGSACYWKRSNADKTIDNGLTKKAPIVTIEPTDTTFSTSDCQTWQLTDCSVSDCPAPRTIPNAAIGPLLSILGSQLNPGATVPPAGPPPSTASAPPVTGTGPAPGPAG